MFPATTGRLGRWFCLGVLSAVSLTAAPLRIFVDLRGTDSATGRHSTDAHGRLAGPVRSVAVALERARMARREQPGASYVIEVSPGRYELEEPLQFRSEDSGIVVQGRPGKPEPTLSGGTLVTGWQPSPSHPEIWEVTVPGVASGRRYFHQLFVRGQRAQRARTPNVDFFRTRGALGTGSPIELPFAKGDLRAEWSQYPDARVVLLAKWTDLHLPFLSIDPTRQVASLPGGPRPVWMDERDARYWVENVPDALDAPGEWYLDRGTGRLRYWAPKGIDPNQIEIVAPRLTQLVQWAGRPEPGGIVSQVTLRHLRFADADYSMPAQGMISPQAAVDVPGALAARYAHECRIEDCTLTDLGGYGLELGEGCQRWSVERCEVTDLGAGGIRVGEPSQSNPTVASANHTHQILDNRLERLGRIFPAGVGILVFHSGTNRIAHNHIRDLYYTGISVGWNWGYESTPCRANEIDHNLVEQIGQGRLTDMGGIYTLGPQPGTWIHHNLFRDIESHDYGAWGLYTDEGSTGILLENNVVYRCRSAGFHQHYGRDNVIRNNVFAFNREHQLMRTRVEDHRSFWFTNNVVVFSQGDLLGSDWRGSTNQFWLDQNLYWDTRLGARSTEYRFGKESWAEWQRRGFDGASVMADPEWRDPKRPELGFHRRSPAYRMGFQPIDLSTVGPRRRSARP